MSEIWIAILGALGLSTVIPTVVTYILKQRDARIARQDEASKATVEDSAQLRGELWQQLVQQQNRNDALAQQRGQLYQEKAEALALADSRQRQVDDLLTRYSTAAQKLEDAEYRRQRDQERFEKQLAERDTEKDALEREKAALERRVLDLEHDIARITRGGPTRATDLEDPPRLRTPDRRRAGDQTLEVTGGQTDSGGAVSDGGGAGGDPRPAAAYPDAPQAAGGGEGPRAGAGRDREAPAVDPGDG